MMRQNRWFTSSTLALAVVFGCLSARWALAEEPTGTVIDSPYEAVEASSIELVTNGDGDVVQIRAKGCPQCPSSSILPSRELIVESGGKRIEGSDRAGYSGLPGVIHIYHPNNMAYRVSFIGLVQGEGGDQ
ncbi:hypothetical protein [Marinobacter santoriniensis]|uniref:hypothetical protein n=1 Tax=Marinobacter santoriniensis TaxID=523742 RepID=UPI0012698EAA|nr:hypothetical protein [Marinobacter santoriniensis]